jgi:hypothetical protein
MIRTGVLLGLATASSIAMGFTAQSQQMPSGFPLAVACWSEQAKDWRFSYLSTVTSDGVATYFAPNGEVAFQVGADKTLKEPIDRPATTDCIGKSLDQLQSDGRLLSLPR